MSVSLQSFLPWVAPWVRDCPDPVMLGAIRDSAIEFCNQSCWWTEKLDPVSVYVNISTYELDLPLDADLVVIDSMRVGGRPVKPVTREHLNARYGYTDWKTLKGQPAYYTLTTPAEVQLIPYPQETILNGLEVTVCLRPAMGALYLPEQIYGRWAEQIGYGARARLHTVPSQSYTDPGMAQSMGLLFREAIADARAERNASLTRGPVMVQRRRWV